MSNVRWILSRMSLIAGLGFTIAGWATASTSLGPALLLLGLVVAVASMVILPRRDTLRWLVVALVVGWGLVIYQALLRVLLIDVLGIPTLAWLVAGVIVWFGVRKFRRH